MAFETEVAQRYEAGEIHGPIHLSGGNEEQLIKAFACIKPADWVLSTWRSHYHALLKGVSRDDVVRQILAGRSMFISSAEHRFYASSIAGGILPIAVGLGLAAKRRGDEYCVWAFVGDMVAEMGIFYESVKYAENFNLPIEFVIEDNGKSVATLTEDAWGCINYRCAEWPHIRRYKYELTWPHIGTGSWVSF